MTFSFYFGSCAPAGTKQRRERHVNDIHHFLIKKHVGSPPPKKARASKPAVSWARPGVAYAEKAFLIIISGSPVFLPAILLAN